ncbi:2-phosphosulfolactate phosphatase [Sediminibacillus albus]|uniref:Probable 2-phosphosulfolactate phosphatase n=1 Tax=Sediminibacillus albus TaxID=407036 RepID=A0A1G8X504_9BACI|nr:2-phosphosulfolactate phosphatase [Sediminibacillus albus]SDJ84895.1 2-phosphosulfolactate phosphatase [Sediminibacillus albus]
MKVTIYQGSRPPATIADITIVIDVIRAFTVAHHVFLQGADGIYLAESVEQAFQLKKENPEYLLAGEVNGLAINGFDLDNSPYRIKEKNLAGRTLVQRTTNGVRATLNCLASKTVFVTGFSNARTTAECVKKLSRRNKQMTVNVIASHPSGDDDLACAEYIKSILMGSLIPEEPVRDRIRSSQAAEKFFTDNQSCFKREDILVCLQAVESDFVMRVDKSKEFPMIERVAR